MRFFYDIKQLRTTFLLGLLVAILASACTKKEIIGEDPYAGGKDALGVRFTGKYPSPERGVSGTEVTFQVKGLKAYEGKFDFRINDESAEVVNLTDSTIRVKVPEEVSTGGATIKLDGQTFFGPRFEVMGKVSIDKNYKVVNGSNSTILDAISHNAGYLLVGGFTNFENQMTTVSPINRIAAISADGTYVPTTAVGKGSDGALLSINRLSSGKYIVSGGFGTYNERSSVRGGMNITRLNADGSLDTLILNDLVNETPNRPQNGRDTVAVFNAGAGSFKYRPGLARANVVKSFVSVTAKGEQITLVGTFEDYATVNYLKATRDTRPLMVTSIRHVMRLSVDGVLDEEYNFDANGDTNPGANGYIQDAYLQSDNSLVIVGDFTRFHGATANRIVRLDNDGNIDPSFNVGTGANDNVSSIKYDPTSQTYLLVGRFTNFNGHAVDNVVRLNKDGSVDESFKLLKFIGGTPNFAQQLSNGKVLISGSFIKYNNITRRGFLVLNNDGSLSQEFNNAGAFSGQISRAIETTSSLGNPAVILIGFIQKFNDQQVGNILRVEIKD